MEDNRQLHLRKANESPPSYRVTYDGGLSLALRRCGRSAFTVPAGVAGGTLFGAKKCGPNYAWKRGRPLPENAGVVWSKPRAFITAREFRT